MTTQEQRDHLDQASILLEEVQRRLAAVYCALDTRQALAPAVGGELWQMFGLVGAAQRRLPGIIASLEADHDAAPPLQAAQT